MTPADDGRQRIGFLAWLAEHGFAMTCGISLVSICIGVAFLLGRPSPWGRIDSRYNECLQIVLRHGSLADAETMCAAYRQLETNK